MGEREKERCKDFVEMMKELDEERAKLVENAAEILLLQQRMQQSREKKVG